MVASVVEGSAAAKAGLQQGDVITASVTATSTTPTTWSPPCSPRRWATSLELVYSRNGAEARVTVTLAEAD